ncbi:MAG TPA: chemotaxis protein CheW [Sphingopyxis sp.]|uniref:chemotaxis protein CheW n=1 Tax=Sphingopyxis sp. TaxID=1908224 RepID=UPI002C7723A0|nr:chemotaxis protein CheW [Sphingopyxis sp.]HWW55487.1 chemotaxis protein CheW [Sphingopyxis sp.]
MDAAAATEDQYLAFRVADRQFAVPTALVAEVARMPRLSRVPHAPAGLLGLANVRGAVLPVLSLSHLLLDKDDDAISRLVVVDAGEPVGLAVSDVRQTRAGDSHGATLIDIADMIARCIPLRSKSGGIRGTAAVETDEAEETLPLVSFAIGSQFFALPLGAIDEVIRLPEGIAILPHADAVVVGSTAYRNATLPLLSLAALLALPDQGGGNRSRVLIVQMGSHRVGLVVDAMGAILRVAPTDIDPVPHVLTRGSAEARIQAICRLDDGARLVSVLSLEQLLRDDITQRLLQSGTGEDETMDGSADARSSEQFLLFRVGEEEFGLPVEAVEEVAALPPKLTRLPKAPVFVQGVMNLRGEVIPVIDQAHRFHGTAATGTKRRIVVVRIGALKAGFLVDAVSEILRVDSEALREAPDLGAEGTRVFDRVANLEDEDKLILIVSPRELLDRAEQDFVRDLREKGASAAS